MVEDFASKYTNANLSKYASIYNWEQYQDLYKKSQDAFESRSLAARIITVAAYAQGRGDIVGSFFHDVQKSEKNKTDEVKQNAQLVGEAITLVIPFVGLPNVMPAIFGLINELKSQGIESLFIDYDGTGDRGDIRDQDYTAKGSQTSASIYRGVGNSDVQEMVRQYFPGICMTVYELKHAELLVTAAIAALGATRQASSHFKGSMQLGNSVTALRVLLTAVSEIADWNKKPLPDVIDVDNLSEELKRNSANSAT